MVAADAAASALGAAVAVVIPTTTHATRPSGGSVVLDGGVLLVRSDLTDDATARATGGRGGALAVALGSRRSSADLAAGSSLRGHLGAVTLGAGSATSTTGTSSALGSAGSLTVVVVDAETLAALRDGAALTGTDDLTLTAGSTDRSSADATGGTGPGRAVVLATVRTGARLGTGTALVLPGDLRLTADQEAAAASAASLVALTLATHDVGASSGRAVTTGGALSMRATGDSRTSSRAPGLGSSSAATTSLTALRTLRLFTDTLATGSGLGGSTALPAVAPSTLPLSSVAATMVRGSASIDLPALPVRAGGPADLVAISGGGSGAGSGGNGNGATPAPSASVVLAILPSRVRVAGTLQSEEDLLLQAGRGPPAAESSTSTAPSGSAAVTVISRPTTVELLAPATAGPGSTRTIIRATTAPVEVIDLPGSTAPQVPATAPEPPAGSVLVTAAIGGTVTAGRATLRFAPGSLPADAFVAIRAERRYVPGLHAVSLVYDLLAWDARTGAPITHFRTAPVLTIGVDGADGAAIWYLAPDGDLERMPTTTAPGSLTAALPHFSQYLAGSPLDGIAGMIVPLLQQYVTDALSGPRTQVLPDLDLGVFVLASPTVTFSGVTGSTGSYTVTVTLSGRVTIGFVDGARPVGGSAALTGTYTVAGEALDAGDLALTLDDLVLTLGDVVTVRAATASLAQDGGDLVVTASAVTAALTVPNGPALQLTATSLDLLVQADRDVAFRVAGGTLALTGVPGVSATGTGWSLVHNGTGADVTLGGTTVLGTVDVQAGGAASLVAAGQTLTATTLTVQRSGRTLTLAATGLGLALAAGSTSVLTVSAGTGTLVVDDTGISGTLTGTATTAPTFTLLTLAAAPVSLAVNTRPVAALGLPAGPFVRVVATGVTLALGSLGSLAGSVSFERQTGTGGAAVVVLGLAGVTASVGANQLLTDGAGLLVVQGAGVAGVVSGRVGTGAGSGFTASADALLRVNTTQGAVEQTVVLDGQSLEVSFSAAEAAANPGGVFALSLTGAVLDVAGVVSVKGDFTFTTVDGRTVFAGRGLTLFVGLGPAWLADGSPNPLARGLLVTGATVGLVRAGAGTVADPYVHALTASGTVQLVGVAGISLAGTLSVRLNQLGQLFSVSVPVAGGDPVVIAFVSGEAGSTSTPFTAITGNLTLTALGQTLTGSFAFTKTAAGLDVSATGVVFRVVPAGASAPVASLTGGTASLRVGSSGLAGRVSGTVTLDAPGVGATLTTGTFALEINTTGAIVPQFGSLTGDLPAGPFLRLTATAAALTVSGQSLSGTFVLERSGTGGSATTRLTITNGMLSIGPGTFVLDGVAGDLTLTSAGVAGRLRADIDAAPGAFALSGAVAVAVNTTGSPADGLPAGPYLRLQLDAATLTVGTQVVTADLTVESTATSTTVTLARASVVLAAGGAGFRLVNGAGTLVLTGDEVSGTLGGTVVVNVPGVTLTGTLHVEVDTAASRLEVAGLGVELTVLGQRLSGDLTVALSGSTVQVTLAGATLQLAGGLVSVTGAAAEPDGDRGRHPRHVQRHHRLRGGRHLADHGGRRRRRHPAGHTARAGHRRRRPPRRRGAGARRRPELRAHGGDRRLGRHPHARVADRVDRWGGHRHRRRHDGHRSRRRRRHPRAVRHLRARPHRARARHHERRARRQHPPDDRRRGRPDPPGRGVRARVAHDVAHRRQPRHPGRHHRHPAFAAAGRRGTHRPRAQQRLGHHHRRRLGQQRQRRARRHRHGHRRLRQRHPLGGTPRLHRHRQRAAAGQHDRRGHRHRRAGRRGGPAGHVRLRRAGLPPVDLGRLAHHRRLRDHRGRLRGLTDRVRRAQPHRVRR